MAAALGLKQAHANLVAAEDGGLHASMREKGLDVEEYL